MTARIIKLSDDLYVNVNEIVAVYWSNTVELLDGKPKLQPVTLVVSLTGDTLYICDTNAASKLLDFLNSDRM